MALCTEVFAQVPVPLKVSCGEPGRKEGMSTRRELLDAIRLGCFDGEPASSKIMAEYRDIKQADSVDFVASSVSVTDAAKDLDVPGQAPLILVLCCLDQYRPIVGRKPGPIGERRFSQSNHVEDKYAAGR